MLSHEEKDRILSKLYHRKFQHRGSLLVVLLFRSVQYGLDEINRMIRLNKQSFGLVRDLYRLQMLKFCEKLQEILLSQVAQTFLFVLHSCYLSSS